MTDKDIVKALRRCTTLTNGCRCDDCPADPLKTGKRGCGYVSLEAADAIERLTAEVARLQEVADRASAKAALLDIALEEAQRLKDDNKRLKRDRVGAGNTGRNTSGWKG